MFCVLLHSTYYRKSEVFSFRNTNSKVTKVVDFQSSHVNTDTEKELHESTTKRLWYYRKHLSSAFWLAESTRFPKEPSAQFNENRKSDISLTHTHKHTQVFFLYPRDHFQHILYFTVCACVCCKWPEWRGNMASRTFYNIVKLYRVLYSSIMLYSVW